MWFGAEVHKVSLGTCELGVNRAFRSCSQKEVAAHSSSGSLIDLSESQRSRGITE